jgi:hypothetical protein
MALAGTMISTLSAWDGSSSMPEFGAFGKPTMGQTVTVPMNDTVLQSFSFELNLPASTTFAACVYEWDDRPPDNINGTGGTVAMGKADSEKNRQFRRLCLRWCPTVELRVVGKDAHRIASLSDLAPKRGIPA